LSRSTELLCTEHPIYNPTGVACRFLFKAKDAHGKESWMKQHAFQFIIDD